MYVEYIIDTKIEMSKSIKEKIIYLLMNISVSSSLDSS